MAELESPTFLPSLPRTVVTDVAGERHRVVAWWDPKRMDFRVVRTACGKGVVLGGAGHPRPRRCPLEAGS